MRIALQFIRSRGTFLGVAEVLNEAPLIFASETVVGTWVEAAPLVREHHAEVGHLPLEDFFPDKDKYLELEKLGFLRLFTAREMPERKLAGYQLFIVSPHPHYSRLTMALQDLIYLSPRHRGLKAIRFILYADQQLEYSGVDLITRHSPERNHGFGTSLERMGYQPMEQVYSRRIA